MIVLMDVNRKVIKLYKEDGIKEIPFDQANTLGYHASGVSDIVYVTQAVNASVQDVVNLALSQAGGTPSAPAPIDPKKDPLHVRYTGKGVLNITDLGFTNKEGILEPETFHGPVDFKLLTLMEKKGFNESGQVQALLSAGKLEVIPLSVCKQIRLEWEKSNNADAELDQMIVPEGMTPAEYIKKIQSGEIAASDLSGDAIEIDLMGTSFGKGSSTKNEGSLIPKDFSG